ncbi:MAG TPA: tellurite resistance TerB family protein [Leptospiraceae bacterium]|nr:tellurite resistance TerB family protein [Leptospiraceae bacterium]HMY67482.1 tellurite resistance TerB family protein [Leptospiraceae bacterium]HMZ59550.1 tellurite resistance TerB family protein [Leptospiraceae bacterium]HNF14133.1 tellurite resistance TerB family protein [Leptospiraceae bacterium]HNF23093.1 tellurite resistance TerB family protein [Leptospiraceae bacterium]
MARNIPKSAKKTEKPFSPVEAIVAVGLVAIAADGVVEDIETESLLAVLQKIEALKEYSEEQFKTLIDRIVKIGREEGLGTLVNSSAEVLTNQALKEGALMTAVLVVASDGKVVDEEQEFIDYLLNLFGISDERYDEILDSIFGK